MIPITYKIAPYMHIDRTASSSHSVLLLVLSPFKLTAHLPSRATAPDLPYLFAIRLLISLSITLQQAWATSHDTSSLLPVAPRFVSASFAFRGA